MIYESRACRAMMDGGVLSSSELWLFFCVFKVERDAAARDDWTWLFANLKEGRLPLT